MTDSFHGSECAIYGAGYDLKPYLKSASVKGSRGSYDASALADLWKVFRAGRVTGEFSGDGFYSTGVGEFSTIQSAIHGTKQCFMLCPEGNVAGSIFSGCYASVLARSVDIKLANMTMSAINATAKKGADLGTLLTPGKQTITTTGFTATLDTLISSTQGGAFYVQCLAYVGTAGKLVVGIEDSADGVTFTAVTATTVPTANIVANYNARLEVPRGTALRQYVRMYYTVTAGLTSADIVGGICKYYV